MSNPYMVLWDFDGTLGYRPGMWSQALLDILREHIPTVPSHWKMCDHTCELGFPGISLTFPM